MQRVKWCDIFAAAFLCTDEATNRRILQRLLHSVGVPTTGIVMLCDGVEALEYIRSPNNRTPHVMLMDIMMPGKTGIEVMQEARPPWPVVAMTGSVDEDSKAAYKRLMFDGLLPKPFSAAQLVGAMDSARHAYAATGGNG